MAAVRRSVLHHSSRFLMLLGALLLVQPDGADTGAVLGADVECDLRCVAVVEVAADGRCVVAALGLWQVSVRLLKILRSALSMSACRSIA